MTIPRHARPVEFVAAPGTAPLTLLTRGAWLVGLAYTLGITQGCRIVDDNHALDFRWRWPA